MSNSLTKNERMSELLVFLSESLIRSVLGKKRGFTQKTDERIPSPDKIVKKHLKKLYFVPIFSFFVLGKSRN